MFVLEEFASHALDCGGPPFCARTNVVRGVFLVLGDEEQVIRNVVHVVENVVANKFF